LIDISELQIQENQLSSLPAEIRQMEELRILDISSNKFECLPTSLYECPKLSTINAKDNKIKGKYKLTSTFSEKCVLLPGD
jgi:Leucine-rich repeat (LRR) protein